MNMDISRLSPPTSGYSCRDMKQLPFWNQTCFWNSILVLNASDFHVPDGSDGSWCLCSLSRVAVRPDSVKVRIAFGYRSCILSLVVHFFTQFSSAQCYDLQAVFSSSSHVILGYLMSHSLDLLSICWNYWSLSSSIRSFNPQGLGTSPAFGERLLWFFSRGSRLCHHHSRSYSSQHLLVLVAFLHVVQLCDWVMWHFLQRPYFMLIFTMVHFKVNQAHKLEIFLFFNWTLRMR